MENVRSRFTLAFLLALAFGGYAIAGSECGDKVVRIDEKGECAEAGVKKPFEFRRGDMVVKLGGKSVTEHRFAKNAVMLNSDIPDEVGHFRQTLDTNMNLAYGELKYGHKAIELDSTLRFKTVWGRVGYMAEVDRNQPFKILGASVGEHSHVNTRSLVWIKNAWLKASWNSIFGCESDKLHFAKLGMFPFELGRGIALGQFYGVAKDFLAIYNRNTDYSAPGVLLTGEVVRDLLWYDLYYSKLEENSASFNDVFNSNKERVLGRRSTPWSGPGKDSDLFAARLKIKPFKKDGSMGDLDIEPYIYYNEASDQKVEVKPDSKSMLGAVGLAAEYKKNNFEIGGEVAFNYGHERLYAIDRNELVLKSDKYDSETVESMREVYSKVTYNSGGAGFLDKNVVVNATTEQAISNNRGSACGSTYNGVAWTPDPADPNSVAEYKNADDRYRCSYKNNYNGWMGVIDASYLFENFDLKVALAYGYASGDRNPHIEEVDKNYDGFVGLYELYSGKRVPSVFILDARKIRRPLTLDSGDTEADSDASFTDIQYFGGGLTWKPSRLKKNNFSVNPNLLFFWKASPSKKYDTTLNDGEGGISACDARKFLGTEFNVIASYDILKDLSIKGNFAIFFPGSYYDDIKGVPMKGDLFNRLEETDRADLPSEKYRLGTSNAFYTQIAVEYKF